MSLEVIYYSVCALVGAAVGATELVSRYRDDPWGAVKSTPGVIYLLLNALSSLAALALLTYLDWIPDKSASGAATPVVRLLAASFGAMTVLRSSILSLRMGDEDVPIGPGAILSVLSDAIDREVDRGRAADRAQQVPDIMKNVSFSRAMQALPTLCLSLMQNVAKGDQDKLAAAVKTLGEAPIHERVKRTVLGLQLVNVIGWPVLQKAVRAAGPAICAVDAMTIVGAPAPVSLAAGTKERLFLQMTDAGGQPLVGRDASWSIGDPGTATVDSLGWVTAVRAGKTTVRAVADSVVSEREVIVA